ncbi:hypothetical protein ACJMK2_026818 [Sinanodonta woodiana]|uniref:Uncharacterized protein n=1 Tax=Sinanodonta woodiana TaxID=1069815 RepID=A0ABD3XMM1_SINWO
MAFTFTGLFTCLISCFGHYNPESGKHTETIVTPHVSDEILKRLDKLDAKFGHLDARLSILETRELVNVRQRLEKLENDISSVKTIGNDLEKHKRAMEEFAKAFLKTDINELKNMIKRTDDKLSVEISKTMDLMLKMQQTFIDFKAETDERSKQVQDIQGDQKELSEVLKDLSENITGISIELLVLDQRTEDIMENNHENSSTTLTIMVNTVLLALVIVYLYSRKRENMLVNTDVQASAEQVNQAELHDSTQYSIAATILHQVQGLMLDKGLCVISFYKETHPLHMRMTMSVVDTFQLEPLEFIVQKHTSILEIPPVCLYWIFVDSNKQNVIFEDPNLGLGDLRVTTLRAIQKMGGKVVILYVRDLNSAQLQSNQLYNPDLVSVTKHQELSALNQLSHVFSAYETLTEFQKQNLQRIVMEELDLLENLSFSQNVNHSMVE